MLHYVIAFACVVVASAKNYPIELTSGGLKRKAIIYVPDLTLLSNRSVPAVVNFHALSSTMELQAELTSMNALADKEGFIVIYPSGYWGAKIWTPLPSPIGYSFNAGGCCPEASAKKAPDTDFTRDLVGYAQTILAADVHFTIDPLRIFATGMSNGGFMANRVGCELAHIFAAIAPVSGPLMNESAKTWGSDTFMCSPKLSNGAPVAMPVLHMHGLKDPVVPYKGSALLGFPPVPLAVAKWATMNGVGAENATISYQHGQVTCKSRGSGQKNVTLCAIEGGGHSWPGAKGALCPSSGPFACTKDIDATQQIWDFFKAHGRHSH